MSTDPFKSTEPPWVWEKTESEGVWAIKPIPGQVVADVYYQDKARLIVKAVNLHEELVAALALILDDVEKAIDYGVPFDDPDNCLHRSVMAARQALDKAEST
jgi:hypothetical protein